MIRFLDCLVQEHDLRLVLPAVLICVLSVSVAFWLHRQALGTPGRRLAWSWVAGLVAATGTWATHFVAMLASTPLVDTAYDPALTGASLVIAWVVMGSGFLMAARASGIAGRAAAGALAGSGAVAMHYTGMAALLVSGHLAWDPAHVAVSVSAGPALAAAAFAVAGARPAGRRLAAACGLMVLSIATLHFTGMSAVTVRFDPGVAIPVKGLSHALLAAVVAFGSISALLAAVACILVDMGSSRCGERRLRELAEATVEGIAIVRGNIVEEANGSFCALVGVTAEAVRGRDVSGFFVAAERPVSEIEPGEAVELVLIDGEGEPVPVMVIARTLGLGAGSRRVLAVRDLREQREAERRIRFLASHDPLTELANRRTFSEALRGAVARLGRGGDGFAVLCLDLDRFKMVNDTLGHAVGDALLMAVAARLSNELREGDLVARLGGDEFAVLQANGTPAAASALAERLVRRLGEAYEIEGHGVVVGASVGIASAPADAADAEGLLKCADMALYRAKSDGRGTFRFFEPEMDSRMHERRLMELGLRRALVQREFELHYQPLIDIASGRIGGFEALLRWRCPERGLVPPDAFIPLAEETGLIVDIGEWVVNQACADAAGWDGGHRIAVNLSTVQFRSPNLVRVVSEAIARAGLDPARLELEITEGVLIHDAGSVLTILQGLKALGVTIAMDDFGTGFSSLSYLQKFPFDKIKIDRSFVQDIGSKREAAAIVRAVASLGNALGMETTAEGVETAEQYERLRSEGCTQAQGFLFSRPVPSSEVARLIADEAPGGYSKAA
jgi:diguanylate cyclase (GGDEF)-like protein